MQNQNKNLLSVQNQNKNLVSVQNQNEQRFLDDTFKSRCLPFQHAFKIHMFDHIQFKRQSPRRRDGWKTVTLKET